MRRIVATLANGARIGASGVRISTASLPSLRTVACHVGARPRTVVAGGRRMTSVHSQPPPEVAGELAVARLAATGASAGDFAFGCLQELNRVLDFDWSIVVAYDVVQDTVVATFPFPLAGLEAGTTLSPQQHDHRVLAPKILNDLPAQEDSPARVGFAGIPLYGLRSSIAVPLFSPRGKARGAVHLFSTRAAGFSLDDVFRVHRIVQLLGSRLPDTNVMDESTPVSGPPDSETRDSDTGDLHHLARELAHRINNPLATIVGYAEMLPSLEEDQRRTAGAVIEAEALRAAQVLQRLMEFAAPTPASVEALDVVTLLVPALAGCLDKLPTLAFELTPLPPVPPVRANREQLMRALDHLMNNICVALSGQEHPTLVVKVASSGRQVRLELRDNRPSVSKEFLATAFDLFANPSSIPEPAQDDLPAAHGLIRANHGTLRAEESPEGGVLLVLALPTAEEVHPPS